MNVLEAMHVVRILALPNQGNKDGPCLTAEDTATAEIGPVGAPCEILAEVVGVDYTSSVLMKKGIAKTEEIYSTFENSTEGVGIETVFFSERQTTGSFVQLAINETMTKDVCREQTSRGNRSCGHFG
ncbi:hypothetical protein R1flu_010040 [Riccia fluitans]|uniref:Uncharacterized protein n=1 Tax=Riccia fluitans TaxID=41844 RepID=A0ABD1Z4Q5_9MARC